MTFEEIIKRADTIQGYPDYSEMQFLYNLANKVPEGGTIVEIGCDHGKSTSVLATVAKERNLKFYTVDYFDPSYGGNKEIFLANMSRLGLEVGSPYLKLLNKTSKQAAGIFKPAIDFLFVDGDHLEEGVGTDCELWLPKLKSGGVVAFHDYGNTVTFPWIQQVVDSHTEEWEVVGNVRITNAKRKP